jgi:3-hydroxybutyrate dehydrogenase
VSCPPLSYELTNHSFYESIGINLSFASLLLSKGCNVLFADLKLRPEAEAVLSEYANSTNADRGKAAFQETDVTEWKQLERMFSVAESHYGAIDIVVPGAGVYEPVTPLPSYVGPVRD